MVITQIVKHDCEIIYIILRYLAINIVSTKQDCIQELRLNFGRLMGADAGVAGLEVGFQDDIDLMRSGQRGTGIVNADVGLAWHRLSAHFNQHYFSKCGR